MHFATRNNNFKYNLIVLSRARLNTLMIAKPEKGRQVEGMLCQMAQTGQLGGKLGESDLKVNTCRVLCFLRFNVNIMSVFSLNWFYFKTKTVFVRKWTYVIFLLKIFYLNNFPINFN